MPKVFLSSPSLGLERHRAAVRAAIARLQGYSCFAMEDFGADDAKPEAYCRARVAECDFLIALVGPRHGSTPPGAALSYSEIEYDEATNRSIPRHAYVTAEDFPVAANQRETDRAHRRQRGFRARILAAHMTGRIPADATPDALASLVVTDLASRVLAAATPDPVGEAIVQQGEQMAILRTPPADDIAAASDPDVVEDHPHAIAAARKLADLAARRHNQVSDAWNDLYPAAQNLLAALDVPTARLAETALAAYRASVRIGSLLDQQDRMEKAPEPGETRLDAEFVRCLIDTRTFVAPMLRVFPSVQRRDGRLRDFLRPVDEPASRTIAQAAPDHTMFPPDDQALLAEIAATAARAGPQGDKAKGHLVATIRNMVLAGATALLLSGYANVSPFIARVSGFFVALENEVTVIAGGMAADIGGLVRFAVERALDDANPGAPPPQPVRPPGPAVSRRTPFARWRDTIEGLGEGEMPEMITLPPTPPDQPFLMGAPDGEEGADSDERPQHPVAVPMFALGRGAVTFAQWDAARKAGAELKAPDDRDWGRDDRPVINVSWDDAQAYCAWLNERLGVTQDGYRLPTEAEWEYACRAGTTTAFSFGATISPEQANYDGNFTYGDGVKGEYRGQTVPVGSLPANPWGLHEMHGNVWEWVQDAYRDSYRGAPADGSVAVTGRGKDLSRVLRGGSWDINPQFLRSASRLGNAAVSRDDGIGFRVARTPGRLPGLHPGS